MKHLPKSTPTEILNDPYGFTTSFTTIERENLRSYKGICELLPISKMPGKPGNTGYTDI